MVLDVQGMFADAVKFVMLFKADGSFSGYTDTEVSYGPSALTQRQRRQHSGLRSTHRQQLALHSVYFLAAFSL